MAKLTDKQQAFINHYLITLNGTEAARRAGYKGNDVTLASVAYENLRKPHLREEIDNRLNALTMSADEALLRMTQIARGDLSQYIYNDGDIDIQALKENDDGRLLKKYRRTRNSTTRKNGDEFESETIDFEFYPADAALRDILKIHGKYGPLGTDDDPIQHRVKFIDYGLAKEDDNDTD